MTNASPSRPYLFLILHQPMKFPPRLFLWLAIVMSALPSARALEFASPQSPGRSLFDCEEIDNVPGKIRTFLASNRALPGSVKAQTLDTATALAHLHGWVDTDKNRPLLEALRTAPQLKTADDFAGTAAFYLLNNQRAEALTCLAVAAERFPTDGRLLFHLASVTLMFGQGNEGLALLNQAERLGNLGSGPLGISIEDTNQYLRAYVSMLQGHYPEAKKALEPLVESHPELSEAALTLALVQNKLGESPRKMFIMAGYRGAPPGSMMVCGSWRDLNGDPTDVPPDPFDEKAGDICVSLDQVIDMSKGQPSQLMNFELPHNAADWRALFKILAPATGRRQGQLRSVVPAHDRADIAFNDAPYSLLKRRLMTLKSWATMREPAVIAIRKADAETDRLWAKLQAMKWSLGDETIAAWQPIDDRYAAMVGPKYNWSKNQLDELERKHQKERDAASQPAIERWIAVAERYHKAVAEEFRLRSQFMSATLAHVGDPNARTALQLEITIAQADYEQQRYNGFMVVSRAISMWEDEPPSKTQDGSSGAFPDCSNEASKWSLSMDVAEGPGGGGIGFEISCSSVSLELNVPVTPFMGISGEVGLDTSGAATVFIGPKFGAGGMFGGGSAKEGMYVTAGKEGVRDIGAKIEVKGAAGPPGGLNTNYKAGEFNLSFMPEPSSPPPQSGPLPTFSSGPNR